MLFLFSLEKAVIRFLSHVTDGHTSAFATSTPRGVTLASAQTMSLVAVCSVSLVVSGASKYDAYGQSVRRTIPISSMATSNRDRRRVTPSKTREVVVSRAFFNRGGGDESGRSDGEHKEQTPAKLTTTLLALAASVVVLTPVGVTGDGKNTNVGWMHVEIASPPAAYASESPSPSPVRSFEVPASLDPWKDGRARKANERRLAAQNVDKAFQQEAEQRLENERLGTAFYAKAGAARRARAAAERDGLSGAEADLIANEAGEKAFENAVKAIDDETIELDAYEMRQKQLRATAETRNAQALAAAAASEAEGTKRAATEAEREELQKQCIGADSPLKAPGSIVCT